jgi:putative SOS response-associated peptidase YedK
MVITGANELASKIHDRMPVLFQPNDFDAWLAGTAGTELLSQHPMIICKLGRCRDG